MEHNVTASARPIVSALTYDGDVRRRVVDMKYRGRRSFARELARHLADAVRNDHTARVDVVTWAPTSNARRRRRGFDQAAVIARHLARELNVPCRRLLIRETRREQTGRSRVARLAGPRFRALSTSRPRRVLVVDDVVTTGATLRAAAQALTTSGWGEVTLAAAASTPGRGGTSTSPRPNVLIRPRSAELESQRPTRERTRSMAAL